MNVSVMMDTHWILRVVYAIKKCHVLPSVEESMEDVSAMMDTTYLMGNVSNVMMILITQDMDALVNLALLNKIMENVYNLSFSNANPIKSIVKGPDVVFVSVAIKESGVSVRK